MEVAHEILRQLGGNRFIAMTGAKNFISSGPTGWATCAGAPNQLPGKPCAICGHLRHEERASGPSLSFRLPGAGGFCKDGINCVTITLDPSDTYTVEFLRIRGQKVKTIASVSDVYNDNLREVFERYTGLRTSL